MRTAIIVVLSIVSIAVFAASNKTHGLTSAEIRQMSTTDIKSAFEASFRPFIRSQLTSLWKIQTSDQRDAIKRTIYAKKKDELQGVYLSGIQFKSKSAKEDPELKQLNKQVLATQTLLNNMFTYAARIALPPSESDDCLKLDEFILCDEESTYGEICFEEVLDCDDSKVFVSDLFDDALFFVFLDCEATAPTCGG